MEPISTSDALKAFELKVFYITRAITIDKVDCGCSIDWWLAT
jgi:hypothetical protein